MRLIEDLLYWYPGMGMSSNTYLIRDGGRLIVDVGMEYAAHELMEGLREDGIDPMSIDIITNTHLHPDHCDANHIFLEHSRAKLMAYRGAEKYFSKQWDAVATFGKKLRLDNTLLKIIPTPGHAPESMCIYCEEMKALICGDLIFAHGVGRTDLRGGDSAQLRRSIEQVSELDIEYLLPGHGEIIIGEEDVEHNFRYIRDAYFRWL
jgi:glyoxylase-like metal-dependent hydrolase (beta-lactamase superfamily II)